jgi:hypothetical protein
MYDAENTNEELLNRVRATMELHGAVEATGRIRGQWHEVLETVEGVDEVYAYWVQADDVNPVGYKMIEVLDADPDAVDLDYAHLVEFDGEI